MWASRPLGRPAVGGPREGKAVSRPLQANSVLISNDFGAIPGSCVSFWCYRSRHGEYARNRWSCLTLPSC